MRHKLCSENDVPEAGSIIVPFFGREVHVYRSDGRVRVAANVCMHFGGPLECRDGAFVCPWHGASYDMDKRQGDWRSGPQGRAADVPVEPRRKRRRQLCLGRMRWNAPSR